MPVQQPQAGQFPGTEWSGLDYVKSALRLIKVLASGEEPEAEEAQDGLAILNQMLDAWSAERLTVYTVPRTLVDLIAGKQTYTLGPGGDFDQSRPAKIEWASIMQPSEPDPLEAGIEYIADPHRWQQVSQKSLSTSLPSAVYDDQAQPRRNLSFWPVPNINMQAALYAWQALAQISDGSQVFTFPPGYPEAIRYGLAVRFGPEFNKTISADTRALAIESLARIRSMNIPVLEMTCEAGLMSEHRGTHLDFLIGR